LAALFALVAAWRWTGLREWLDLGEVIRAAAWLRDTDQAWLWAIGAFLAGGVICFPVTLLIFASAFLMRSWPAIVCSLAGCILSAALLYGIGRGLGRKIVMRLAGRRLNRVNRLIAKQGVLAVTAVRMIPVAPYSVVNLVAGAMRVPFRDFVLGTLLGMSPGVVGITFFTGQLEQMIRRPSVLNLLVLIGTLFLMFGGIIGLRRWITSKQLPRKRRLSRLIEPATLR
jgi:phospholipase D1/2